MIAMDIDTWLEAAPAKLKEWITSVPVVNFIYGEQCRLFQMQERYGAMSEDSEALFKARADAVADLHDAVTRLMRREGGPE